MERILSVVTDVRLLFYGELPGDMDYKALSDAPKYVLRAVPCFLLLVVLEFLVAWLRGRSVYRINDTVMSLQLGSFQQMVKMWYDSWIVALYLYVHENYAVTQLPCTSVWTWIFLFFAVDCGYYWFHRLAHEFHFMWAAHSVHHSGEDYNLATALRQGALQGATSWIFYLPLNFFVHPVCLIAHNQLNTLYQFWIHTSVVGHIGPLEYFFNTAMHHRMHHRPPGNCNYAGVLIIWDRMFGTFVAEDEHQDYFGLATQYKTFDPVWANVEHCARVVRNVGSTTGIFGPVFAFFKRRVSHALVFQPLALFKRIPAMKPGAGSWVMPKTSKRNKLDGDDETAHHWCLLSWVVASCACCVVSSLWVQMNWRHFTLNERIAYFVWVTISMISCGRLSDSLHKGKEIETIRLLAGGALVSIYRPASLPISPERLIVVFGIVFGLWLGCFAIVSRSCANSKKSAAEQSPAKKTN